MPRPALALLPCPAASPSCSLHPSLSSPPHHSPWSSPDCAVWDPPQEPRCYRPRTAQRPNRSRQAVQPSKQAHAYQPRAAAAGALGASCVYLRIHHIPPPPSVHTPNTHPRHDFILWALEVGDGECPLALPACAVTQWLMRPFCRGPKARRRPRRQRRRSTRMPHSRRPSRSCSRMQVPYAPTAATSSSVSKMYVTFLFFEDRC